MINCNNCNVIVTKLNFCSVKCRVAYHRSNASVTGVIDRQKVTPEKQANLARDIVVSNIPTRKIKLDKKGYCPHYILGGNNCVRCNELQ